MLKILCSVTFDALHTLSSFKDNAERWISCSFRSVCLCAGRKCGFPIVQLHIQFLPISLLRLGVQLLNRIGKRHDWLFSSSGHARTFWVSCWNDDEVLIAAGLSSELNWLPCLVCHDLDFCWWRIGGAEQPLCFVLGCEEQNAVVL